ncbi:MAG: GNAT family N-acetyltransferase [Weeksellaceae bacterium]|nr:GNAT family N-acetyltransferase [Weeksellaceae bacterium]
MKIHLRKALFADTERIWDILQQAIKRRKNEGSSQWQDGYPNPETVQTDIANCLGYVLTYDEKIIAYAALIFNDEPAYEKIEGKWLTNNEFYVVHRVAVADEAAGKGVATILFRRIEEVALKSKIFSIRVDTNYDNAAMLKILNNLGYTYCGEVFFRGSTRKAFEKVLA